MPNIDNILKQLKKRKVFRSVAIYAAFSFVLIQVCSIVVPALLLPDWTMRLIILLVIIGFPTTLVLSWIYDITPAEDREKHPTESTQPLGAYALTGLVLTVIGIGFWVVVGVFGVSFGGDDEVPSIAIIPFDNKGAEEDEFYAYGISSELISDVAGAGIIRVAGLKDIEKLEYQTLNYNELSEKLLVRYIAQGTLWKIDSVFQLSMELYDTKTSKVLWSESWQKEWNEIASIKGNLAENILKTLKVSTKQDIVKAPTTNAEAYQYYLMGRYKYKKQNNDGDISVAKELLRKAIELDDDLIDAQVWLGKIYQDEKNNNKALSIFEKSLKKSRILGDSIGVAGSLLGIGDVQLSLGKRDSAIMCYKKAIEIEGEIGDKRGIARLKIRSCLSHSVFDDLESQIDYYQESLVIAKEMGDSSEIAYTLMELGNAHNRSMSEEAINYYNQALVIYEKLDDIDNVIWAVRNIGLVYDISYDYDKALKYYEQALAIAEENEHKLWIIRITMQIGSIYYDKGDEDKAFDLFNLSLEMAEKEGNKKWIRNVLRLIGWQCYLGGYYSKALDYFNREHRIIEEIGDNWGNSNNLTNIGLVYFQQEDYNKAVENLEKSATIQMEIDSTIKLETASHLFLSKKILGQEYNITEIHALIKEQEEIIDYINFALFKLLEDTSYLETAYNQIQEKADAMEDKFKTKFLSYPIHKAIVEEWEKVK